MAFCFSAGEGKERNQREGLIDYCFGSFKPVTLHFEVTLSFFLKKDHKDHNMAHGQSYHGQHFCVAPTFVSGISSSLHRIVFETLALCRDVSPIMVKSGTS